MRLRALLVSAATIAAVLFPAATAANPPTFGVTLIAAAVTPSGYASSTASPPPASTPPQNLPPGAIKMPGAKCATVIQPPDGQGCPGPPSDIVNGAHWCIGSVYSIGDCLAAEAGFFNPPYNFRPRNAVEACIDRVESDGNYSAWNPSGHYGRWQVSAQLWRTYGGQTDFGAASPAEQDRVFVNIVAVDGYDPWLKWDGC